MGINRSKQATESNRTSKTLLVYGPVILLPLLHRQQIELIEWDVNELVYPGTAVQCSFFPFTAEFPSGATSFYGESGVAKNEKNQAVW